MSWTLGERMPPVVVLGGNDNALAIARSLGRRQIRVYVATSARAPLRSRYVTPIPLLGLRPFAEEALDQLLGTESSVPAGSVMLAASDDAIQLMVDHHGALADRYILERRNPLAAMQMLDKLATYEVARRFGVPTPRFWPVFDGDNVTRLQQELMFPLIVKPIHTHLFEARFGKKFTIANDIAELSRALSFAHDEGVPMLLTELIPGPDSELCSYYTYIGDEGRSEFDVTKRIIRRNPPGMGLATYHITDDVPEIVSVAQRLFHGVGLRGIANAEFKFDHRDSTFKLIECNARFTASIALIDRAGADLAGYVYDRLVGLHPQKIGPLKTGLTMWDPLRDLGAYGHLRRTDGMRFATWFKSVARPHAVVGQFSVRDPVPELVRLTDRLKSVTSRRSDTGM